MAHVFFHFFDEQDDVLVCRGIRAGSQDGGEGKEIAAHKDAGSGTRPVQRVGGQDIFRENTIQDIAQEGIGEADSPGFRHQGAHGSVDAHHAGACAHPVQGGNIAEPDQPFGVGGDGFFFQQVHQVDGAVAAPVAQDGFDIRVFQGPFQIGQALLGRSGIGPPVLFAHIRPYDRLESPVPQDHGGRVHVFHGSMVGRRNQGDFISFL